MIDLLPTNRSVLILGTLLKKVCMIVESGVGHSVLLHCNPKCKLWSLVQKIWLHYTKGNCHKFNMNDIHVHVIPLSF